MSWRGQVKRIAHSVKLRFKDRNVNIVETERVGCPRIPAVVQGCIRATVYHTVPPAAQTISLFKTICTSHDIVSSGLCGRLRNRGKCKYCPSWNVRFGTWPGNLHGRIMVENISELPSMGGRNPTENLTNEKSLLGGRCLGLFPIICF